MVDEKGKTTVSEEISELRRWMREDINRLHDKFDKFNEKNNRDHESIVKMIAEYEKRTEVKTAVINTKVGLFVAFITIVVTGAVHAAWSYLGGG